VGVILLSVIFSRYIFIEDIFLEIF